MSTPAADWPQRRGFTPAVPSMLRFDKCKWGDVSDRPSTAPTGFGLTKGSVTRLLVPNPTWLGIRVQAPGWRASLGPLAACLSPKFPFQSAAAAAQRRPQHLFAAPTLASALWRPCRALYHATVLEFEAGSIERALGRDAATGCRSGPAPPGAAAASSHHTTQPACYFILNPSRCQPGSPCHLSLGLAFPMQAPAHPLPMPAKGSSRPKPRSLPPRPHSRWRLPPAHSRLQRSLRCCQQRLRLA
jgi:hypothetical protein